jgi:hypothetical protein
MKYYIITIIAFIFATACSPKTSTPCPKIPQTSMSLGAGGGNSLPKNHVKKNKKGLISKKK